MHNPLQVQAQIRNNATDIRNYIQELYDWEEQVTTKKQEKSEKKNIEPPPIRGNVEIDLHKQNSIKQLQRDSNCIKDYYNAWNKFDIDKELDQIDEVAPIQLKQNVNVLPEAKIVIKGGRQKQQLIDANILKLKEEGNQKFKQTEYSKAIDFYSKCQNQLEMQKSFNSDEQELLIILHSNKAQCYLNLNEPLQALREANNALSLNPKHLKSLQRKGTALKTLGKLKESLSIYKEAFQQDPIFEKDIKILENKLKEQKKNARQQLIYENYDKILLSKLDEIYVKDVKQGKEQIEELEENFLKKSELRETKTKEIEKQSMLEEEDRIRTIRFGEVSYDKCNDKNICKFIAQPNPNKNQKSNLKSQLKYFQGTQLKILPFKKIFKINLNQQHQI